MIRVFHRGGESARLKIEMAEVHESTSLLLLYHPLLFLLWPFKRYTGTVHDLHLKLVNDIIGEHSIARFLMMLELSVICRSNLR